MDPRQAATEAGVPTISFEVGEPMKFQRRMIRRGAIGIRNVLADLGMNGFRRTPPPFQVVVTSHGWVRARKGGIPDLRVRPGDIIERGRTIAVNTKPFGTEADRIRAPYGGLVVSCATMPMVFPGAAVCHLVPVGVRGRMFRKLLKRRRLPFD